MTPRSIALRFYGGHLPQTRDVPQRRGAEQATVLAAELGGALVADLKRCGCRILIFGEHQPPRFVRNTAVNDAGDPCYPTRRLYWLCRRPAHELFFGHVHLHGGPAPVRRYLPDLIGLVLKGKINPGQVFDLTLPLDQVAEGYRAMDERRAIKTLLRP